MNRAIGSEKSGITRAGTIDGAKAIEVAEIRTLDSANGSSHGLGGLAIGVRLLGKGVEDLVVVDLLGIEEAGRREVGGNERSVGADGCGARFPFGT